MKNTTEIAYSDQGVSQTLYLGLSSIQAPKRLQVSLSAALDRVYALSNASANVSIAYILWKSLYNKNRNGLTSNLHEIIQNVTWICLKTPEN